MGGLRSSSGPGSVEVVKGCKLRRREIKLVYRYCTLSINSSKVKLDGKSIKHSHVKKGSLQIKLYSKHRGLVNLSDYVPENQSLPSKVRV